jgi:hypothetical protein
MLPKVRGCCRKRCSAAVDCEPAIDDQLGAGNVFGLVGREEQSRIRDISDIAHPPHRTLPVTAANHLFGAAAVSDDDLGAWTIGVSIIPGRIEFARIPTLRIAER